MKTHSRVFRKGFLCRRSLLGFVGLGLSLLISSEAFANVVTIVCPDPYFGFDLQRRYTTFRRDFGNNIFTKNYPQGNVFVGLDFNDFWGLELGYESTTTRTQVRSINANATALGIPMNSPLSAGVFTPPVVNASSGKLKGWNGSLVGYIPVYRPDCVYLFGTIGFARLKLTLSSNIVQDTVRTFPLGAFTSTFSSNKTVLALGAGALFLFGDTSALRVKLGYENTARFRTVRARETNLNGSAILKPHDSLIYGLGVVVNFY